MLFHPKQFSNAFHLTAYHGNSPRSYQSVHNSKKSMTNLIEGSKTNLVLSTRHPIERAISSWYDKFMRHDSKEHMKLIREKEAKMKSKGIPVNHKMKPQKNKYMVMYNRTIMSTLGINKLVDLGDDTHHITFKQYVQWITTVRLDTIF